MAHHGVVHFEIPADDPDALSRFYSDLFGWQITKIPVGDFSYYITETVPADETGYPKERGVINGGIYKRETPDQRPVNYVNVESIEEYVEKARRLGARVLIDKMAVPGMGYFAQLMDPQGNPFGVWRSDMNAG